MFFKFLNSNIHIKLSKYLMISSSIFAAILLITSIYLYPNLPSLIPIHINIFGTPDGFGGKNYIFMWPLVVFIAGLAKKNT